MVLLSSWDPFHSIDKLLKSEQICIEAKRIGLALIGRTLCLAKPKPEID